MPNFMEDLNLEEESIVVEAEKEFETVTPGVYEFKIEKAYVRDTDTGAKMIEVLFKGKDGEAYFNYSTCVQSGDEKGNKTTYTSKTGKEVILPGLQEVFRLFVVATGSKNIATRKDKVIHKDQEIEATILEGLSGKIVKIGIINKTNLYEGTVSLRPEVHTFMDREGRNVNKEYKEKEVADKIALNPIKKLSKKDEALLNTKKTGNKETDSDNDIPDSW